MTGVTDRADVRTAARSMLQWVQAISVDLNVKKVGLTSIGGSPVDACIAALTLARMTATPGRRVMLVDLERSQPLIERLCGIKAGPGIADLVTGTAEFTKVIGRDMRSPIHVLRYGFDHSPRAATFVMERIESVLSALAQTYDFIVVNLGEAEDSTPVYLHKCEAALLLAPESQIGEVSAAVRTLLDTGLAAAQYVMIVSAPEAAEDRLAVNA